MYKIVNILIFVFIPLYAVEQPKHAKLILACESGYNEHILKSIDTDTSDVQGLGAVTGMVINALFQEAAPIIMSSAVYENLYFHAAVFQDFITLDTSALQKKYQRYKRFSTLKDIKLFRADCKYAHAQISTLNSILQTPNITEKNIKDQLFSNTVFDQLQASESFKILDQEKIIAVGMFLQTYIAFQNASFYQYDVYGQGYMYVAIPKTETNVLIDMSLLTKPKPLALPKYCSKKINFSYKHIFVKGVKALIMKDKRYVWSIFMCGHGYFSQKPPTYNENDPGMYACEIAGLSVDEFRKLLVFFDRQLAVNLFFYESCSGGGKNFVNVYTDPLTDKPLKLHYMVGTNTLCEAPTKTYMSFVPFCIFRKGFLRYEFDLDNYIDKNNKKPKLRGFNYKKFFSELTVEKATPEAVADMFSCVSAWIARFPSEFTGNMSYRKEFFSGILSIRFPQETKFTIIDPEHTCSIINNNRHVVNEPAQALLLYSTKIEYISFTQRAFKEFPACISMVPGAAKHVIDVLSAPRYGFCEIIKGFFPLKRLYSKKMIKIKELVCKNDVATLKPEIGRQIKLHDVTFCINFDAWGRPINTVVFSYNGNHYHYTFYHEDSIDINIDQFITSMDDPDEFHQAQNLYEDYFDRFDLIPLINNPFTVGFDIVAQKMKNLLIFHQLI